MDTAGYAKLAGVSGTAAVSTYKSADPETLRRRSSSELRARRKSGRPKVTNPP